MNKIIITLFLFTFANSQESNFNILFEDNMKTMVVEDIKGVSKSIVKDIRAITGNSTDKEKCDRKWSRYFNATSKISIKYWRENQKIKKLLLKKHINYYPIIKQRTYIISINTNSIIKHSCTTTQFEQLKAKMKNIERLKIENIVYKELMHLNNLELAKSDYIIKKSANNQHIKAIENLKEQLSQ